MGRAFCVRSVLHLLALALGKKMGLVKLLVTPQPSAWTHPPLAEIRWGVVSTTRGRCAGKAVGGARRGGQKLVAKLVQGFIAQLYWSKPPKINPPGSIWGIRFWVTLLDFMREFR